MFVSLQLITPTPPCSSSASRKMIYDEYGNYIGPEERKGEKQEKLDEIEEERPREKRRRMEQDGDEPEDMYLNVHTIPDYAIPDPDQAELSKLNEIIVPCSNDYMHTCGWWQYDGDVRGQTHDLDRYIRPLYMRVWLNENENILFIVTDEEDLGRWWLEGLEELDAIPSNSDVMYKGSLKKDRMPQVLLDAAAANPNSSNFLVMKYGEDDGAGFELRGFKPQKKKRSYVFTLVFWGGFFQKLHKSYIVDVYKRKQMLESIGGLPEELSEKIMEQTEDEKDLYLEFFRRQPPAWGDL